MTLHARIALVLGWPEEETKRFPLQALRELVRPLSAKLAHEINVLIRTGRYILPLDNDSDF